MFQGYLGTHERGSDNLAKIIGLDKEVCAKLVRLLLGHTLRKV